MPEENEPPSNYGAQRRAESECVYCEKIIHQPWCPAQNANIQYVYRAIMQPDLLNIGDQLILHALGVAWTREAFGQTTATFA